MKNNKLRPVSTSGNKYINSPLKAILWNCVKQYTRPYWLLLLLLTITPGMGCQKNDKPSQASEPVTDTIHWTVNGADRKAIMYIPASAKTKPTPVIFNFHGFGVLVQQNYRQHRFDTYWPDAIVVWPEGLTVSGEPLGLPAGPG